MEKKDLLIIGGGSAGMAAAIAAYDQGIRDILILERTGFLGGILNQCIHNGFGLTEFKEELTGPEFLLRFVDMVKERGIAYKVNTNVTEVTKDKVVRFINEEGAFEVQAKAIVMAAGCYERSAGAIGMSGDRPSGVITAGQAQLYLNDYGYLVGKKVFILGSGDIGLIMARRMTLEGAKVLGVAELMPYSNGLERNLQQCLRDFDIPLYLSHTVSKVIGKGKLEAIEISKVDENLKPIPGTEKRFEVDTLLLSIGLIPNNDLLDKAGIERSSTRGSKVDENMMCVNLPGVFSCGNVLHVHDLVDNVVAEARIAGRGAAAYIRGEMAISDKKIPTEAGPGIGYVVPSFIHVDGSDAPVEIKFRVRQPSKDCYVVYSQGDTIIKKMLKPAIIPSEMEIFKLPKNLLVNDYEPLRVSLVPKEGN